VDDLPHAGIEDALEALALAPPPRAEAVVVAGRTVVRDGRLLSADEELVASELATACRRMRQVAGV